MFNAAVDQDIEEDRKADIAEIEADQKAYEEMKKEQDREDENRRAEWLALPLGKFGTFDKAFKTRTLSDFFDSTQTRDTSISGLSKEAKSTAEVIAKYFWV